ncbi:hypothetical protein G5I_04853 [Acromyrmex echinatior]|uniref:Uncharacterized protein n=1 Tax=Acromyrmex echinatior TaxID=103372 RepID=F4WGQ8_ACREC|nr:hypothetical protein G5I_04853 [Acromyrmex echinatior]
MALRNAESVAMASPPLSEALHEHALCPGREVGLSEGARHYSVPHSSPTPISIFSSVWSSAVAVAPLFSTGNEDVSGTAAISTSATVDGTAAACSIASWVLSFWGRTHLRFSRDVVCIPYAFRAVVFVFPFLCVPVPRVTEAGDSRDLSATSPEKRGGRTTRIGSQETIADDRSAGGAQHLTPGCTQRLRSVEFARIRAFSASQLSGARFRERARGHAVSTLQAAEFLSIRGAMKYERVARSLVPGAQLLFCDYVPPLRAVARRRISVTFRLTPPAIRSPTRTLAMNVRRSCATLETMRENGEGVEGRLDSISQVYARRRTPVSRTHLFSSGIWVNVRRDALTPIPLDNANVGLTFWVKELNPFDPGLDLVRSQVFEGSECERREVERTGTSDPSRSTRDLVKMKGAGIDPKEEGVGILLRDFDELFDSRLWRRDCGWPWGTVPPTPPVIGVSSAFPNGEWPRRSIVSKELPKGSRCGVWLVTPVTIWLQVCIRMGSRTGVISAGSNNFRTTRDNDWTPHYWTQHYWTRIAGYRITEYALLDTALLDTASLDTILMDIALLNIALLDIALLDTT